MSFKRFHGCFCNILPLKFETLNLIYELLTTLVNSLLFFLLFNLSCIFFKLPSSGNILSEFLVKERRVMLEFFF